MSTESLTAACRAALTHWRPAESGQEDLRRAYVGFLDTHADGWRRETAGAHLTASALICAPDGDRVLLTLHRRIGRWLQTGGHVEPDDADLPAAALREAYEESGLSDLRIDPDPLRLDRHAVPCGPTTPTYHLDVQFLVVVDEVSAPVVSGESADVAWFAVEDVPTADRSVVDLVAAARRRLAASGARPLTPR